MNRELFFFDSLCRRTSGFISKISLPTVGQLEVVGEAGFWIFFGFEIFQPGLDPGD